MSRRIRNQHLQARSVFGLPPVDQDSGIPPAAIQSKPQVSDRPEVREELQREGLHVPHLRRPGRDAMESRIGAEQLSLLTDTSSDVLAYQVADLALRTAGLDPDQMSDRQIKGVEALDQMMRMIEHLNILKSERGA